MLSSNAKVLHLTLDSRARVALAECTNFCNGRAPPPKNFKIHFWKKLTQATTRRIAIDYYYLFTGSIGEKICKHYATSTMQQTTCERNMQII